MQYLANAESDRPRVVPEAWVADTIRGAFDGPSVFRILVDQPDLPAGAHYRSYWWIRNPDAPFLYGWGIYGQNVFVHGPSETVVVKLSTWPTPVDRRALNHTIAGVLAIARYLEQ